MLGFMFDVPDYIRWLGDQDYTWAYRYVCQQLQLLSWKGPGGYSILKSPGHQFALERSWPPSPTPASCSRTGSAPGAPLLCSLAAGLRGILTDRLDLRQLGAEVVGA